MKQLTYIIKRSQIEGVFDMCDYVSAIEEAFRLYGERRVQMPSKVYISFDKGDLRCMPAYIPSMNIAGVKNVNVHPGNKDMPSVMATITLFNPETGFPMAIMDGTYITNMRTGAAGGVAAKYLSREDSAVSAFIGAGIQARTQLDAILITRPGINKVVVYDINEDNIMAFTENIEKEYGLDVECKGSVGDAVGIADIVTTTTPVRDPIVKAEYIRSGTHINAIGADAQGKQEFDPEILKKASIVVDNWEQASCSGEINVALSRGIIKREDIYGDIGEIVTGEKNGREYHDQITLFDSTGLAIQDIYAAGDIYRRLMSDKELELKLDKIDFLAGLSYNPL